jgi:two-component system sensor histidine kinase MprB
VDVDASVDDGGLVLTVGDRGPGITPEDAARAFEPFFRARRAGGVRGSGLGLTICARLCETAGASIALAPRQGGGTLAIVRWPLARA